MLLELRIVFGNFFRIHFISPNSTFTDQGGLEICRNGDRSSSADHFLPRHDSRDDRHPDGRSTHI